MRYERSGAEYFNGQARDPGEEQPDATDAERAEKWVSHSCLEWGDYTNGGADVPCANAVALPDAIGLKADSELIRRERGMYGYTRIWIRLEPAPSVEEWESTYRDCDETEADRLEQWRANVEDVLKGLDDYPLIDDEGLYHLVEEWASAAWDDFGRSDVARELPDDSPDGSVQSFREFWMESDLSEFGNVSRLCGQNSQDDFYIAEGGEGGIYFRTEDAKAKILANCLGVYLESIPAVWRAMALETILDSISDEKRYESDRQTDWDRFESELREMAEREGTYSLGDWDRLKSAKLPLAELATICRTEGTRAVIAGVAAWMDGVRGTDPSVK